MIEKTGVPYKAFTILPCPMQLTSGRFAACLDVYKGHGLVGNPVFQIVHPTDDFPTKVTAAQHAMRAGERWVDEQAE